MVRIVALRMSSERHGGLTRAGSPGHLSVQRGGAGDVLALPRRTAIKFGGDAHRDLLRRDRADVEADGRVDARELLGRTPPSDSSWS